MLKILDTRQIRELDDYTICQTPISSIDLMESACNAFVKWFAQKFQNSQRIGIVCGTGNNGGDGLGIARMLSDWGYSVNVWIVRGAAKESEDFRTNLGRLPDTIKVQDVRQNVKTFESIEILIDAVFGSGLSRPPEGIYAEAINAINQSKVIRVAVDIPSGLFPDAPTKGPAVMAAHTVSFQLPKLAFLFPENEKYVGSWYIVDIGLSAAYIKEANCDHFLLTPKSVRKILKKRLNFTHKGDYGKALLIAGSYGKMGACVLAARAALRSGLGLLTAHVPKAGYTILQSSVPEAMASIDNHNDFFSGCPILEHFDVIGIGPGLGQAQETEKAFKKVLEAGKPLVIDADGLNLLGAKEKALLSLVSPGNILTPHPGEFERLAGKWTNDFERHHKQKELAKQTNSIVVLKGAYTSIATPEGKVFFNCTGNPGMATGGSGDVLTGIITGLLAQNYSTADAAILGVYLHGASGDLAARDLGMDSLIASDIVDYLPKAFIALTR